MNIKKKIVLGVFTSSVVVTNMFGLSYGSVNGEDITDKDVASVIRNPSIQFEKLPEQSKRQVLSQIISEKLLTQYVMKSNITQTPEYQQILKDVKRRLATQVWLNKGMKEFKVSDKDVKKFYADNKQLFQKPAQYKARHILVQTQKEAQDLIAQLDKARDKKSTFISLAKSKSTGPSGVNGGDLGWFDASKMVPEFSLAVKNMAKGSYSKTPVKTQFGYHVIFLEDKKGASTINLAQASPKIKQQLKQQGFNKQIQSLLRDLQSKAKINVSLQTKNIPTLNMGR